jgi:hypothetical protein
MGYCWRTPKGRNLCISHAFLEGKKAGDAYARKSGAGTLKEVSEGFSRHFLPPVSDIYLFSASLFNTGIKNHL